MLRSKELRHPCPMLLPVQATWPISWPCTSCYHSSSWQTFITFLGCPLSLASCVSLPGAAHRESHPAMHFLLSRRLYGSAVFLPTCLPNQWGTVMWESVFCSGSSQLSWTVIAVAFESQETVPYIHWCRKDALELITSQGKVCQKNLHLVPVTMSFHEVSARLLSYCPGQCTWFLFSA